MATQIHDITPDVSLLPKSGQVNYQIPDGIGELVDNEIDARIAGELLTVEIYLGTKGGPTIQVKGNGSGMDADTLADAMRMGYSTKSGESIGQFGLGMKTACTYLGRAFEVVSARVESESAAKVLYDDDAFLAGGKWEIGIEEVTKDFPHGTVVTITQPRVSLYAGVKDTVAVAMGRIFRHFIKSEQIEIYVNGDIVMPYEFDLLPDYTEEFKFEINGKLVRGWTGLMRKPSAKLGYGFELIRHNRVVERHEKIGFNPHPKLRAIVGEVHLDDFEVINNKTAFLRDSDDWRKFEAELTKAVRPLVDMANKKYQATLGPREEAMVADVTQKVEDALRSEEFARHLDHRLLAEALEGELAPVPVEQRNRRNGSNTPEEDQDDVSTPEEATEKRLRTPKETREVLRRTRMTLMGINIEHEPVRFGPEAAYKWWDEDGVGEKKRLLVSSNLDHPMFSAIDDTITWIKHNIAEAAAEFVNRETGLTSDMLRTKSEILRHVGQLAIAEELEEQLTPVG